METRKNIELWVLRDFIAVLLTGFFVAAPWGGTAAQAAEHSKTAASAPAHGAQAPKMSLPVDCVPSKTCFIQNYVDMDPGPDMRDYTCGKAGFDGHKGVDIRVISRAEMARGVKVLAAAPGRVIRVRDGMADIVLRSQTDRKKLKGKDCGNGLVIDHPGGLRTQYCHMRRGSLKVRPGQIVSRGQELGLIGLSGNTAFPHLHLTTRLNGKIISPFSGARLGHGCNTTDDKPLWTKDVLAALPYHTGEIIKTGFASGRVNLEDLRAGKASTPPRSKDAAAMVFYAWAINLRQGDVLKLVIDGPRGRIVSHRAKPLPRRKAVYFQFAGKKRPKSGWPQGTYQARVEVIRDGKGVIESSSKLEIK